jgi:chlorobactene glucosyltransferase
MLLVLQLIVTFICVAMSVNAIVNFASMARDRRLIEAQPLPDDPPFISVLVPARNEARHIQPILRSLVAQDYPNFEVVVLDDCSTDGTGELARAFAAEHPNIRILTGTPLEPGWIGKPNACRQLAEAARGRWLLFTDADTVFGPRALSCSLKLCGARRLDLLTGLPAMEVVGFWERISVPFLAISGLGLLSLPLIANPRAPWWFAAGSGAFLFFRREAYETIGGHHVVRSRIVEDITLVRYTKRAGYRVALVDVSEYVRCRMYRSLREVWEGFTKNFRESFPGALMVGAIFYLLGCFTWPWVAFAFGPAWGFGFWTATGLPLIQLICTALVRVWADDRIGKLDLPGLLMMPLAGVFLSVIALRSLSRHIFKQSTPWRDRHYDLWKGDDVSECAPPTPGARRREHEDP